MEYRTTTPETLLVAALVPEDAGNEVVVGVRGRDQLGVLLGHPAPDLLHDQRLRELA
jgi:hypothetical protein